MKARHPPRRRPRSDALSPLGLHRDKAEDYGRGDDRQAARSSIPRQQFDIPIQAAIGGKIISRFPTVKAYRKDVTAKLYGGDIKPQEEAAREAEGGQEADEVDRLGSRCPRRPSSAPSASTTNRLRLPKPAGADSGS